MPKVGGAAFVVSRGELLNMRDASVGFFGEFPAPEERRCRGALEQSGKVLHTALSLTRGLFGGHGVGHVAGYRRVPSLCRTHEGEIVRFAEIRSDFDEINMVLQQQSNRRFCLAG